MAKTVKTRIQLKHDTEANWNLATGFIPLAGEMIIYDVDATHSHERFKIGDGVTVVTALPFADEANTTTQVTDDGEGNVVLTNVAVEGGAILTETDPTVPAWAKEATKPSYTASEVGALPSTTSIPSTLADLTGDSTHRTVTDVEKTAWNAKSNFSGSYNDLTNKPTIPSIAGLATETYVDTKVAGIVDSSPEALNTLNELAAALGDDPNFATTVATEIGKKVDKVSGKGLSTNDYTTAEKDKLAGIAAGANAYTHPSSHPASMITGLATVATSGSYNDLTNKPTIPAAYSHPTTHPASMITGLATVATSGKYSDLSGTPTIPTIPASLPANGGNADTVDNKHASDFAPATHTHNYAGSSSAGGAANSANSLISQGHLTSATAMDDFITANAVKYATFKLSEDTGNLGFGANDGMLLSIPWSDTTYGVQLALDDAGSSIAIRSKATNWRDWSRVLHSENYKTYVTPANIGAATSGHTHNYAGSSSAGGAATTALTCTGNAATATKATQDASGNTITSTYATKTELSGKANSSHTHTKSQITDFPTIPTVNNATLTIQKNGTNVATFTANSSTNATANITVPTKVSELTNDSGFKTTDNNTTYTVATGDSNGQIKVTPSSGSAYNVSVKGLGSAAYTASTAYAAASHGTHVSYSSTAPVMDGTASVGSASTVARSDHKHPIDTSRAAASDLTSHTGNTTVHITSAERTAWNAKSNFSGSYNDLTNKPTIPAAYSHPSTHAASMITSGTFANTDVKAKSGTDYSTARVRNISAGTSDMTAGSTALASGDIYFVYE